VLTVSAGAKAPVSPTRHVLQSQCDVSTGRFSLKVDSYSDRKMLLCRWSWSVRSRMISVALRRTSCCSNLPDL
jgi:hypothetical protein